MLRNNLIVLSTVLLSACSIFNPPPPGIKVEVQKVEVPIAVPCKAQVPTAPTFNFDKLTPQQDIYQKDQALLADRLLHLGYEKELLTALTSCIK